MNLNRYTIHGYVTALQDVLNEYHRLCGLEYNEDLICQYLVTFVENQQRDYVKVFDDLKEKK